MAVMGQRPKSDLLENGKVAYGGETCNQGLIWGFGMYNVQGRRQLCTGPAPLMGEPAVALRAPSGSPISGAGKDHLIFNKKWS